LQLQLLAQKRQCQRRCQQQLLLLLLLLLQNHQRQCQLLLQLQKHQRQCHLLLLRLLQGSCLHPAAYSCPALHYLAAAAAAVVVLRLAARTVAAFAAADSGLSNLLHYLTLNLCASCTVAAAAAAVCLMPASCSFLLPGNSCVGQSDQQCLIYPQQQLQLPAYLLLDQ
jgi:hypothetical protein